MRQTLFSMLLIGIGFTGLFSCDKVENAYKPGIDLTIDTTFYPGNWVDYENTVWPQFEPNTNTDRNVLVEDYTGHKCNSCPNAATTAHNLSVANPNRVFVAGIHAGPGGITSFQTFTAGAATYHTDHTSPEGVAYGLFFQNGYNFFGNPQGTVNRKVSNNKLFDLHGTWGARTQAILDENDLKFNIQSVCNYYSETEGGYLHVEVEKLTSESIETNLIVFVLKDEEINWQKMPDNSDNETYLHEHKHIKNIDGLTWGRPLNSASAVSGTKFLQDYAFAKPAGIEASNLHFLIFVYDTATLEILQVIKQKLIP
jgi:hypothetical protein